MLEAVNNVNWDVASLHLLAKVSFASRHFCREM